MLLTSNIYCQRATKHAMQQGMRSGARPVQMRCTLTQRRLMPSTSCHERAPSVPCGVKVGVCSAWAAGGAMATITTQMVECTSEGCCSYSTRSAPYCRPDLGIHPCMTARAGCHTQFIVIGVMGSHMSRQKLTLRRCTSAGNARQATFHQLVRPPRFLTSFVTRTPRSGGTTVSKTSQRWMFVELIIECLETRTLNDNPSRTSILANQ